MEDTIRSQRTYALMGYGGAGKTSLAEALLFKTGVLSRLGTIKDGTTCLDYEPEEVKRTSSIQPAFASYLWNKNRHFFVDIPGATNFSGDMPYFLNIVDGVVFLIDAVDGINSMVKRNWSAVEKEKLPAIIVINKFDREFADFDTIYADLQVKLGIKAIPMYLPIIKNDNFVGVIDVLSKKACYFEENGKLQILDIPQDLQQLANATREIAVENIAESDENLMELYLETGDLSDEILQSALKKGVLEQLFYPICIISSLENKGIEFVLQLIQNYLPSPFERPMFESECGKGIVSALDTPFSAFVCKTFSDQFMGQVSVLRVLSGSIGSDMQVLNSSCDEMEKLGHLSFLEGKKLVDCKEQVGIGSIIGVVKLKNTKTGDTLCDASNPVKFKKPNLPNTIISYALTSAVKGEEDKAFSAIHKLLNEDILLQLRQDSETGDILLSGMGQAHVETAVEKARRRYKVDIILKTPRVPYRETIERAVSKIQGKHKKQSGGRGQFGDCFINLEPSPRGTGYQFVDAIVGGAIPKAYIPAVDKGIQESAVKGILAGFPMIDFKATLYDGSYHNVDSSEMAFKIAGSLAFKKAAQEAQPVILEPIMHISVFVPDQYIGDIIGDIASKRGRIIASDSQYGITEIIAHIPMNEVLQYASELRSLTKGQGNFNIEFDHYAKCPSQISTKIIDESKREK